MSLVVLLTTAASLGLLGGLHCVAMCAALQRIAVHGVGGATQPQPGAAPLARTIPLRPAEAVGGGAIVAAEPIGADLRFHAARMLGYAALGAAVGGGSWLLRWGADAMPLMRPLWGTLNGLLLALGLALLVLGRQPTWVDALGARVWRATGARLGGGVRRHRPELAGLAWALVPCGLLYSALATAALASDPLRGAAAMLAFAAGTAANLLAAQWVLHTVGRGSARRAARAESAGIRIGGALLAAMAVAALVALALGQPHPFCAD
ncbi:MAG: sulfite exporter TauE/SafE family protein [Burkholderiaceae bacterium]|jgi:sulfite exporter TauE/SafE|nr:sulfite exporter TauE/SafE family protein [Burkholderiales bacterium]MCZ8100625.1 sulfite exporter TauE/SafE family protein [Burkholderiales bacterium]MCZ8337806.1 sulfite exporter TauE/SafE family protein [Burkholderiaceae bacterium]